MIQEDYVSFETAKLLRQLGFDEYCTAFYYEDGSFYDQIGNYNQTEWNVKKPHYSAAEHWQVLKWLRIKHNIFIIVDRNPKEPNKFEYFYQIKTGDGFENTPFFSGDFDEWEEATEAAIQYCLKNLIK